MIFQGYSKSPENSIRSSIHYRSHWRSIYFDAMSNVSMSNVSYHVHYLMSHRNQWFQYLTIHDTNHTIWYDFIGWRFKSYDTVRFYNINIDYLLFSVQYIVLVCKWVSMIPIELFIKYKTINVTSMCSVYILENLYIL
jgi:hypothetical protein